MLATALGHRAVEAGYRVYYTTAADLVARTTKAAIEGRWANTMRFWNGPQLLIIDELGYLPMPGEAAVAPLPSHQPPLRTRLDRPDHQPRHRRLGPDLRRHHRRRRHPRPPPTPRHRPLHHRRQLPHAPPPRRHRTPSDPPSPAPKVGNSRDHTWGILVILDTAAGVRCGAAAVGGVGARTIISSTGAAHQPEARAAPGGARTASVRVPHKARLRPHEG